MGILMDGAKLEPLMIDAGFVDVNVMKLKIQIGEWGAGIRLIYLVLISS